MLLVLPPSDYCLYLNLTLPDGTSSQPVGRVDAEFMPCAV